MDGEANNSQEKIQGGEPIEWSPQLTQWLERVSNPISRDIEFLVDIILEGYITDIVVDTIRSYNET